MGWTRLITLTTLQYLLKVATSAFIQMPDGDPDEHCILKHTSAKSNLRPRLINVKVDNDACSKTRSPPLSDIRLLLCLNQVSGNLVYYQGD